MIELSAGCLVFSSRSPTKRSPSYVRRPIEPRTISRSRDFLRIWLKHAGTVAALISAIEPLRLPHSTRDMLRMNRMMFNLGRLSPRMVGLILPRLIRSSLPSMDQHVRQGTSPSADLSPEVFAIMAADQREAMRTGGQGIAVDMRLLWQPWGFQFEDIHTRVCVWHGAADNLAPAMLVSSHCRLSARRRSHFLPRCRPYRSTDQAY